MVSEEMRHQQRHSPTVHHAAGHCGTEVKATTAMLHHATLWNAQPITWPTSEKRSRAPGYTETEFCWQQPTKRDTPMTQFDAGRALLAYTGRIDTLRRHVAARRASRPGVSLEN